jgi:hypothetical protein
MKNPQAKQRLAVMLAQSFQSLRTYGKEPEQIGAVISMFNMVLADYTFEQIEAAFAFYLKTSNEMPAPADIANIIERGNKPTFDRTVYLRLAKRLEADPYAYNVLSAEEREYMKDYERFQVTGKF